MVLVFIFARKQISTFSKISSFPLKMSQIQIFSNNQVECFAKQFRL